MHIKLLILTNCSYQFACQHVLIHTPFSDYSLEGVLTIIFLYDAKIINMNSILFISIFLYFDFVFYRKFIIIILQY